MNKKLVCYFSASGVTKKVAEKISYFTGSDLFEIEPAIKYSDADLDWKDENSRSSMEMKDRSSRPSVENKVSNIEVYDVIILGFPVWWYTAPTIINTFIEENDLSSKKVYIFVTSGSSSSESSFNDLKDVYPNIDFVSSRRFTLDVSEDEVVSWIKC